MGQRGKDGGVGGELDVLATMVTLVTERFSQTSSSRVEGFCLAQGSVWRRDERGNKD
jgi:hypothetical protein